MKPLLSPKRPQRTTWRSGLLLAGGILWLLLVMAGMRVMALHEFTPGVAARPFGQWPQTSALRRAEDRPTLVLFLHPQCPCSRASLEELARIVARCRSRLTVYALFCKPIGTPDGWEKTGTWHQAQAIPGVQVLTDLQGVEARRFTAKTSGQALLYAADGRLLFSGGITASRGHSGDNDGSAAILQCVEQGTTTILRTPVFGCSLLGTG